MDKRKNNEIAAALVCYLLTVALLYMAQYAPILAVAIPFVLAFAVVYSGYALGGAAVVLALACGLLFNVTFSVLAAAAFLPIACAAGYMIREKKRFRDGVMLSILAALVGAVLAIFILTRLSGKEIVDFGVGYVGDWLSQFGEAEVKLFYTTIRSTDVMTGAITQEALLATPAAEAVQITQDIVNDILQVFLVYFIILYALVTGFLSYVIPRAVAKKRGISVGSIPAFSEYTLPRRLWLGALATVIFAMIGAGEGWQAFDLLQVTLYNVFAVLFMAQGLCLLDYFLKKRKLTTGVRVVVNVIVLALFSGMLLPLVGLAENAFGIRKRLENTKGGEAQ